MNQYSTNRPNPQNKGDNHQLITFNFENNNVRIFQDENGQPLFVAKDVATILGYVNTKDAVSRFCHGVVKHDPISDSLGRTQNVRVIYEPDLYRLTFGSKLESAVRFQNWVFEEVLPTIRKTGQYQTTPATTSSPIKQYTDEDLQHLKEVYKIPELAKVLGLSEEQTIHRLYQSYPKVAGQSNPSPLIDSQTQQLLNQFWQVVSQMNIDQINHAKNPNILAINLPELYNQLGEQLPQRRTMLQALKHSILPKFQTNNQSVNSAITNNTKKCWVFVVNEGDA